MFRKIILCVDDKPNSHTLTRVAADMAGRYEAEIVVLSILDPARFASPPYSGLEACELLDKHSRTLSRKAHRIGLLLHDMGFPNSVRFLPGQCAQTIADVAAEEQADLIVMGGRQKGWLRACWEGDLYSHVARRVACNVMRVAVDDSHEPPQDPPAPPKLCEPKRAWPALSSLIGSGGQPW